MDELTANKIETTDIVDISSDLADSLDAPLSQESELQLAGESAIKEFEAKIQTPKFDELRANYPSLSIELFPSMIEDENVIRKHAQDFYLLIERKSKQYLKNWVAVNDYQQIWKNSQIAYKGLNAKTQFQPMTYSIYLQHQTDELKSMTLVSNMPTAAEARIQGVKKLGFLDSIEYKKALKSVPAAIMAKIETETKYLKELKQGYLFDELRRQVNKQLQFAPDYLKARWDREIEERISLIQGII